MSDFSTRVLSMLSCSLAAVYGLEPVMPPPMRPAVYPVYPSEISVSKVGGSLARVAEISIASADLTPHFRGQSMRLTRAGLDQVKFVEHFRKSQRHNANPLTQSQSHPRTTDATVSVRLSILAILLPVVASAAGAFWWCWRAQSVILNRSHIELTASKLIGPSEVNLGHGNKFNSDVGGLLSSETKVAVACLAGSDSASKNIFEEELVSSSASGRRAAASASLLALGLGGVDGGQSAVLAAEEPKTAIFSAGDARFLQAAYEGIRYKGISSIEVGRMTDGTRAVRVTYDPARCTYKQLVGAFWRNTNPTDGGGQFGERGTEFRPIIWVNSDEERQVASKSGQLMEASAVFGPPIEEGKIRGGNFASRTVVPFAVEIREAGAVSFEAVPADGQDFCKLQKVEYKELFAKTGRKDFFEAQFKPTSTSACKDGVCGYTFFPCTAENRCTDVANGSW